MDVGVWLRNLGLGQYERVFIENVLESDVLPDLTEGDLEKLGIPLGDRKRLIKAIRATFASGTIAVGGEAQGGQPLVAGAERRHLTVMICDLVGSTALSNRLDPAVSAACSQPHTATPPDARCAARSTRGSRSADAHPAFLRRRPMG
jgi:hypothetical protein